MRPPAHPNASGVGPVRAEPLGHPLWWLALLVWVLNDHCLKGSAWVPGWLTGKLSDVTGLIVMPALVAQLTGAATFRTRWLSIALVAVPFAAINIFQGASDAAEHVMRRVGVPSKLWCDGLDLLALLVLPFTARLLSRSRSASGNASRTSASLWPRLRLSLGAALAGLSCVATSYQPPGDLITSAYIVNGSFEPVDVELFRAQGPLDCDLIKERSELDAVSLGSPVIEPMNVFQRLPLDRAGRAADEEPVSDAGVRPECEAVVLRAKRLSPIVVYWSHSNTITISGSFDADALDEYGVMIESVGAELRVGSSKLLTVKPYQGELP